MGSPGFIPIRIEHHCGIQVVRDDIVPGGTKARFVPSLLRADVQEYVYASPVQGYAQVALAICARAAGKIATIFCAGRAEKHPNTLMAEAAGARMVFIRPGYLSVVRSRAAEYCNSKKACLLPFGLETPEIQNGIARLAASIPAPAEVWTVAGSGTLNTSLQIAWPAAQFHAIRIGAVPKIGRAKLWTAPEKFDDPAKYPPPFPSCKNYDAKAWQFIRNYARPGALFWNVAG